MRGLQKPLLVGLSLLLLGTLAARPRTSVRGAGRTGVHYWTPVLDSGAAEHVSVATQRDDRPLTLGRRLQRRSLRHAPVDGGGAPSTGAACHLLRLRRLLRGLATRRGSLPPLRHREAVPGLVGGLLAPLMRARLDLCQAKGFDAVEPDNIDGYQVDGGTGFPLTAGDQLRYNRWIAAEAHCRGLSIGLKNDSDMRTIGRNRTGESKAVPSPRSWLRRVAHAQSVRVDVVVPGTPCAGSSSRASGSSTVKTLPFPG